MDTHVGWIIVTDVVHLFDPALDLPFFVNSDSSETKAETEETECPKPLGDI